MIEQYNKIKPDNVQISKELPQSYVPNPTTDDYKKGFINRYFFQKKDTEGAPIFEVDKDEFRKSLMFFKKVSIKWYIKGKLENTFLERITIPSVIEQNKIEIKKVEKEMPELKLYLVNLKQFWKPL